jgi:hypothetical protein
MSQLEQDGNGGKVFSLAVACEDFLYGEGGIMETGLKVMQIDALSNLIENEKFGGLTVRKNSDRGFTMVPDFDEDSISRRDYGLLIERLSENITSFRVDLDTDFADVIVSITSDSVEVERRARIKGPKITDIVEGDKVGEIDSLIGMGIRKLAVDCGIPLKKEDKDKDNNPSEETDAIIGLSSHVVTLDLR